MVWKSGKVVDWSWNTGMIPAAYQRAQETPVGRGSGPALGPRAWTLHLWCACIPLLMAGWFVPRSDHVADRAGSYLRGREPRLSAVRRHRRSAGRRHRRWWALPQARAILPVGDFAVLGRIRVCALWKQMRRHFAVMGWVMSDALICASLLVYVIINRGSEYRSCKKKVTLTANGNSKLNPFSVISLPAT